MRVTVQTLYGMLNQGRRLAAGGSRGASEARSWPNELRPPELERLLMRYAEDPSLCVFLHNERSVVVLVSAKEYKRLIALEDAYWGEMAKLAVNMKFVSDENIKALFERLGNV